MNAKTTAILAFACLSLLAFGQQRNASTEAHPKVAERELNACGGEHEPGDSLTCYVRFDGEMKFTNMAMNFDMRTPQQLDQKGLCTGFSLSRFKPMEDGWYAVEGTVPNCGSGTYLLYNIGVNTASSGSTGYNFGTDFAEAIRVTVHNPEAHIFPKIEDVSGKPPKEERAPEAVKK